jgi:aminopeptidase N
MLVYLPICGFFDATQQHFLGIGDEEARAAHDQMYWKTVTPHEVAHQWWGQTVGFGSYRDQWMSEGFADASAAMFLQATRNKPDDYLHFWKEERTAITEKNEFGFRANDVGPVTMGFRLSSPKAGWNIYGDLVYPKGAYILHMVRMMMWSPKEGDARFNAAMHGFVSTHTLQPATTEDFKAAMEKYMSPNMDLDHNHRMDWFFNEYVYGTELPAYHFESQVTPNPDGTTALNVKLVQSGVSPDFKMPVPLYLELADGRVMRLGLVNMEGDKTFEHSFNLPKLPAAVKRATINYYYDVLSVED